MKCTNLVTRIIPCQCIVDDIYTLRVRTVKCIYVRKDWSQLMDLASGCIDREVIKFGRFQDELLEWRNKCFESKSFCTPRDTNAIDFNTLWN